MDCIKLTCVDEFFHAFDETQQLDFFQSNCCETESNASLCRNYTNTLHIFDHIFSEINKINNSWNDTSDITKETNK